MLEKQRAPRPRGAIVTEVGSALQGSDPASPPRELGQRIPIGDFDATLRTVPGADLSDAEVARTVELLRESFNGGPGWFGLPVPEADHLRWKLSDAPFETRAAIAEQSDGRMIGFSANLYRRWLVRGAMRRGRDSVESALHPDYQGSGLYGQRRALTNQFPRAEDFRISFASHPASLHIHEKESRPRIANPLDNLVLPLDVRRYARRGGTAGRADGSRTRIALEGRRRRLPRPAFARQAVWQGRLLRQRLRYRPLAFPDHRFTILTAERFDDRIDAFFEKAARPFALIQWRDEESLNWRYADRRAGPFTIRLAEEADEIVGYAVTRAVGTGAELADVLALPGREDVAHALVRDAMELGRRVGAPAIRSWMLEHHPYHPLLLHNGFLPVRRIVAPAFVDYGNTEDYGFLRDPHASLHIMLGDTDHI